MKIIISPSKTKQLQGKPSQGLFSEAITNKILSEVKTLSVAELAKALKIAEDKAEAWKAHYEKFETAPEGMAIESYNGLVFKRLGWSSLDDRAKTYGLEHLCILSGLYGVVAPESGIKDYRLDLVDKVKIAGQNLYQVWGEMVSKYFAKEDWILNLASKEYSKLVNHSCMVTVEFLQLKKGIWKQASTASKQMRGELLRYICEHQVTKLQDLPKEINGFELEVMPEAPVAGLVIAYKENLKLSGGK